MKSLFASILAAALFVVQPLHAEVAATGKVQAISPTEGETLATIAAIDKNEIIISLIASNKNVSSEVKDFAKTMVDQHGANLTKILFMSTFFHVPLTGISSEKFNAQGKKELMDLSMLVGDDFAKAYINAMVKDHQEALNLIDQNLMQTAKTVEMKRFMTDTRAAVAKHLEDAKQLQQSMASH